MKSVSGGLLAGSIGSTVAGLLGGVGQSTFSSNIGLSIATGATSRAVALPAGLLLIALAFLPELAAIFAAMPQPVVGAMLVYVACFMILGGFQVVTSRMLDARRTFVVGIPFIFGLSVKIVPEAYQQLPSVLRPFFASSLSLATILVVLLNLVFRIGVRRKATLSLAPGADSHDRISEFLDRQGGAWGMRPEVVVRANDALHELAASIGKTAAVSPAIAVEARFDEFNLDLDVSWDGEMVALSESAPTAESLKLTLDSILKLSGFLIRHYTDRVTHRTARKPLPRRPPLRPLGSGLRLEQRVRQALLLVVEVLDDRRSRPERVHDRHLRERQDAVERAVLVEGRLPRGLSRRDEEDGLAVEAFLLVDPHAHDRDRTGSSPPSP